MNRKPPIHCAPCRVTFNGTRYRIFSDGSVVITKTSDELLGPKVWTIGELRAFEEAQERYSPHSDIARLVRREAARLRRNRNNRERHAAMKDLGLTKTKYGWE